MRQSRISFILLENESVFLLEHQLAHFLQADSNFALEFGLVDLEIRSEAAFEIPSPCNLAPKPSRPPVVESCSEQEDDDVHQGSKIRLLIDTFKIFGYQTCFAQAEVINVSFGTFSLSVLLRTFGIMQNGEKHTGICVPNSVEMYLLHDYEDLISMQRKWVSDVIDGMQTNLYRENPLFGKLSEK